MPAAVKDFDGLCRFFFVFAIAGFRKGLCLCVFAPIALAVAGFVSLSGWQMARAGDPWTSDQYQLGGVQ